MAKKEKQKKQYDAKKHIQMTGSDRVMNGGFYLFITVFSIICLIPFLLVLGSSFTAERALTQNGYNIWPSEFSLDAYKLVFVSGDIPQAYLITVGTTIVGTFFSMVFTCGAAYAMSVKNFKSRGVLALFIYFTMLFNGGLVANYLLTTKFLHLQNNILVLLPSFCNAWNILLMRNFFSGIPASLAESAKIDGANDITILIKIIIPISLPGIATIGLFYALTYWNEWYNAMLYIEDSAKYPLQYFLQQMVNKANAEILVSQGITVDMAEMPSESIKMATAVVATGPIILVYPFVQKYFVQGLTVGAVKG